MSALWVTQWRKKSQSSTAVIPKYLQLYEFMGISSPPKGTDKVYLLGNPADRVTNRLGPIGAVQGAVLDGLAQMLRGDVFGGFQVGDAARHFQDAVVGTRRKTEPSDGVFQQFLAIGGDCAVLAEHLRQHLRIRTGFLLAAIAFHLAVARCNNPQSHCFRVFR